MITLAIIAITLLISISAFNKTDIFHKLSFSPYTILTQKHYERFITYGFVHADWIHLTLNMFVLYLLGTGMENVLFPAYFGKKAAIFYLMLYILGIIVAAIPSFIKNKENMYYTVTGASGAVNSVLFSSILLYPVNKINLFFIPIGMPAPIFGILYLIYSYYSAKKYSSGIAHDVHFWGALWGICFTIAIHPSAPMEFIQMLPQAFQY